MKNYYGLLIFLCLSCPSMGQVKFLIESLPETTPAQDSIFITGTFNSWNTGDPKYLLRKQPNGQLAIVLSITEPVIEYKFTRGDWLKVETGRQNEYIPNRLLVQANLPETVPIRILNWQDLGGARSFEYLTFYYFAIAFLASILAILSLRLFKKNPNRQRIFAITHGLMVLLYLGAVAYYVVNPIWQTYLLIWGQALIFVWGPVAYLFVKCIHKKTNLAINWDYFVPLMLAIIIATLRLLNLEEMSLFSLPISGFLTWGKLLMMGTGGVMTLGFLMKLMKTEKWHLLAIRQGSGSVAFFVFLVCCICVSLVFINLYLESIGESGVVWGDYKWFFMILSVVVWVEVVALWRDPQFFKEKPQIFHIDLADELLSKLKKLMEKDKVYHEPELSVNRLAELLDTKPHILSKLLNEHFEQNFRDFVNNYRVREFIYLANMGKLEKLTYLGLAHEVGFNSKSTFNLAFKKITQKSPREYFRSFLV